jgi:hypothetical protein
MVLLLNSGLKSFPACFLTLIANFSGQGNYFGACFELFGRRFGHLATVLRYVSILNSTLKDEFFDIRRDSFF